MEKLSLEELREALAKIEAQRAQKNLDSDTLALLEDSACLLRQMERKEIASLQKELAKKAAEGNEEIKELARRIRERVNKMNKVPKAMDKIDSFIKGLLKVLTKCGLVFE